MLQILDILREKANDGLRELVRLWHSSWADVAVKVAQLLISLDNSRNLAMIMSPDDL